MMSKISWKTLEETVRAIAAIKWKCPAQPEHLGGIDFDAVLYPSQEEIILIEVTKRSALDKVREDITKINSLRLSKISDGILCKGFIILEEEPTSSMVETAKQNKVTILSLKSFTNSLFNYDSYISLRLQQPFGSSLNPFTGKPDEILYIPVKYQSEDEQIDFEASTVAKKLADGEKLVLVGDYGTGKSRCIRQVFDILTSSSKKPGTHIFAINLREHWGASSASEIIAGHLEELGLSGQIDNTMQIINTGGAILLLDGIDEVGAQVFGSSKESRITVRRKALEGIRKLVNLNKGGILVTSRSHYFDSDEEMLDSIGISSLSSHHIIRCPEEFSDTEASEYLRQVNIEAAPPHWLPRKPLVFQVLSTIDKSTAAEVLAHDDGEFAFWGKFITAICEREARIHGSLQADAVRQILINLANYTREGLSALGKLSTRAVREAYEKALHDSPDQAGEQMLMRLCTLGRVSPESPERQFVDEYIVDGLRAEGLIQAIDQQSREIANSVWKQPLSRLGSQLVFDSLTQFNKEGLFRASLASLSKGNNNQAYMEILSALVAEKGDPIDCHNQTVLDSDVYHLVTGSKQIKNLHIKNSFIRKLEILPEPATKASTVLIDDCQIEDLLGVSSQDGMPNWIKNSDVNHFESLSNSNRIRNSNLSSAHILFLSVVHKIFFQAGAGREEKSLLKGGFGQKYEPKLLAKIINILLREKIIEKLNGDDGPVYKPVRRHTRRMNNIKNQLALSGDELWNEIASLSEE